MAALSVAAGVALLVLGYALGYVAGRTSGYQRGHAMGFTTGQAQPRHFSCRSTFTSVDEFRGAGWQKPVAPPHDENRPKGLP